jgi:hypothetical protein
MAAWTEPGQGYPAGAWREGEDGLEQVPGTCGLCGEREDREMGEFWDTRGYYEPEGHDGTAGHPVVAHPVCGFGAGLKLA